VEKEEYGNAAELLAQVVAANPDHALAWNALGFCKMKLKDLAASKAALDNAIRINPSYANAYRNRAALLRLMGDKSGAEADTAKWKELSQP
jgi:Flp pilus assembly protein TadD